MLKKLTNIDARYWHWKPYSQALPATVRAPGDGEIKKSSKLVQAYYQNRCAWKQVAVLRPVAGTYVPWQMGYKTQRKNRLEIKLCSIWLRGEIGGLVGKEDVEFFGFCPREQNPLEIELVEITTKDKLPPDVPLI